MQLSAWESIGLNVAYGTLAALTGPVVDSLGGGAHTSVILAWAGFLAIPLNILMHSISGSVPGPLAPPDPPEVKSAMAKAGS